MSSTVYCPRGHELGDIDEYYANPDAPCLECKLENKYFFYFYEGKS